MPKSRNHFGIFYNKNVYLLALKYNLDLYNKNAYFSNNKYISLFDVKYIIDNLWIDHFLYLHKSPIFLNNFDYLIMKNYILNKYFFIFI
tara:strand:+ start:2434 stop:2700 length:267 start_codon:yes stop_codon:yes gene_type:complete